MLRFADLGIDDVQVLVREDRREVQLVHRAGDEQLSFALPDESVGTRTWFGLIGPVLTALRQGHLLLFDEIDARLHPRLSARLIELFQDPATNPRNAQIIFTTHDTSLLNHLNRDEVWITEKGADGATTLTALAQFGGDKVRRSLNWRRHTFKADLAASRNSISSGCARPSACFRTTTDGKAAAKADTEPTDSEIATRRPRKTLVIFCEGERTEPLYLEALRKQPNVKDAASVDLRVATEHGMPDVLVSAAIKAREKAADEEDEIDEFWCVFESSGQRTTRDSARPFSRRRKTASNWRFPTTASRSGCPLRATRFVARQRRRSQAPPSS
jgi:hypothetical protein